MRGIDYVGEGVDRLICVDLNARGVIYRLYDAARKLTRKPLTAAAAELIAKNVKRNDTVIIATGFRLPPLGVQETDGVLGAASLARTLRITLNVKSVVLIEKESTHIITSILSAINEKTVKVLGFPIATREETDEEAEKVLKKYNPSILIAVEKAGSNSLGEYHTMKGENVTRFHARIEVLFEKAKKKGITTLAVGDGGNEIGMGNIKEAVKKYVPFATRCACPCKGGIAAESKVDLLVTAAVSNWGAYGIQACLVFLTQKHEAMHSPEIEKSMLNAAVRAGAIDGITQLRDLSVDGVPLTVYTSLLDMLQTFPTINKTRKF